MRELQKPPRKLLPQLRFEFGDQTTVSRLSHGGAASRDVQAANPRVVLVQPGLELVRDPPKPAINDEDAHVIRLQAETALGLQEVGNKNVLQ